MTIIRKASWRGIELRADEDGRSLKGRQGDLRIECYPSNLSLNWDVHIWVECSLARRAGLVEVTKPVWATAYHHDLEQALEIAWNRLEGMTIDLSSALEVSLTTCEAINRQKECEFDYGSQLAPRKKAVRKLA